MKSVIDINGRLYDVRTGAILSKKPVNLKTTISKTETTKPTAGFSIDGVNRRKPRPANNFIDQNRHLKKPIKNGALFVNNQKAKTLIRSTVKKPSLSTANPNVNSTFKNGLINRISESRAQRANLVKTNENVDRFGVNKSPKIKVTASLPVVDEPKSKINELLSAPPVVSKFFKKSSSAIEHKQEVFEHKILKATNHLNPPVPKEKFNLRFSKLAKISPKIVSISAACLLIIVLGGYFAYLRIPSIAMKIAANQAGFGGRLPSNIPAGFSFKGPIVSNKGNISVNYISNSDTRRFEITQKPTNWSSESLLTNFLIKNNTQYQTYHDRGLTVFIYDEGNATWIDKGIWYKLTGQNSLSSEQILAIASSM